MPQVDEGITACRWLPLDEALEALSYDNARGVLRRGGEMARTLVAVGAGRPQPQPAPVAAERLTGGRHRRPAGEPGGALTALRRSLPMGGRRRRGLPQPAGLCASCSSSGSSTRSSSAPRRAPARCCATLRADFPGIPVVAYAPFRPDDGELLAACRDSGWPRWRSRAWTIRSSANW